MHTSAAGSLQVPSEQILQDDSPAWALPSVLLSSKYFPAPHSRHFAAFARLYWPWLHTTQSPLESCKDSTVPGSGKNNPASQDEHTAAAELLQLPALQILQLDAAPLL